MGPDSLSCMARLCRVGSCEHNAGPRFRIPRQLCRMSNRPVYHLGAGPFGDLTTWLEEAALAAWGL